MPSTHFICAWIPNNLSQPLASGRLPATSSGSGKRGRGERGDPPEVRGTPPWGSHHRHPFHLNILLQWHHQSNNHQSLQVKIRSSLIILKHTHRARIWRKVGNIVRTIWQYSCILDPFMLFNVRTNIDMEMDGWMLVLGDKTEISWCGLFQIGEGQRAGKEKGAKKKTRGRYQIYMCNLYAWVFIPSK